MISCPVCMTDVSWDEAHGTSRWSFCKCSRLRYSPYLDSWRFSIAFRGEFIELEKDDMYFQYRKNDKLVHRFIPRRERGKVVKRYVELARVTEVMNS